MAACIFCKIIAGELDADRVYEGPKAVAFLDHRPLFPGHVLLVPREHVETLPELPAGQVGPLFTVAQRLAAAVQQGMQSQGTFVAINNKVSQSVPHLHVHVVPRTKGDGLKGFFWPRHPYPSDEARRETAGKIRNALNG